MRVFLFCLLSCCGLGAAQHPLQEDKFFWWNSGQAELQAALKVAWNLKVAKNVVLFVGDGMGPNTITASRIYKAGEQGSLSWEHFPHIALLKTYAVDKQVPDSACTATAMFTGVKSNYQTSGLDARVHLGDCFGSLHPEAQLSSIISWAQDAGKDTGFVTTTRVTHATPSALYSHTANRKWECEAKMPHEASLCKDIARQLIEDNPGQKIKVVLGGGRQCLTTNATSVPGDPIDNWACSRKDGRDLIQDWANKKRANMQRYKYVTHTADLDALDVNNVDYVLGIFANGHMSLEHLRDKSPNGMPSIQQMTTTALKLLMKNEDGFLLVVEGGMIDFAHHRGMARKALEETVALDRAVDATIRLLSERGILDETLVVVTSDHTHSLAINGYPARGNSILGIAQNSKYDNVPYTTLSYATGGSLNYHYRVSGDNKVERENPAQVQTTSFEYTQQAAILNDEATHGGGDVAVYAMGPMAHLFHSVHEQSYVAHVIGYASQIGAYTRTPNSATKLSSAHLAIAFSIAISSIVKL